MTDPLTGEQTWVGSPSNAMAQLGEEVTVAVNRFPEELAGARFCSRYDGMEIFAKTTGGKAGRAVAAAKARHPEVTALVHLVPASQADQLRAMRVLMKDQGQHDRGLQGEG